MGLSGILHWLVSQSIFLVAIDLYDSLGRPGGAWPSKIGWKSCGYSPIAIVSVLILGILMVVAGIGIGHMQYTPGINLAGSCSAAMSAACHHIEWDGVDGYEAARSTLKWGVIGHSQTESLEYRSENDRTGHCAFSSKEVEFPEQGNMYA
jgi:hypothetical protein